MKTKINQNTKKEFKRLKMDYNVNLAFEFLYLFEEHCPMTSEISRHIREIENLLQKKLFFSRDTFLDETVDYALYLIGYNYVDDNVSGDQHV